MPTWLQFGFTFFQIMPQIANDCQIGEIRIRLCFHGEIFVFFGFLKTIETLRREPSRGSLLLCHLVTYDCLVALPAIVPKDRSP
jgi:hypothetical protein